MSIINYQLDTYRPLPEPLERPPELEPPELEPPPLEPPLEPPLLVPELLEPPPEPDERYPTLFEPDDEGELEPERTDVPEEVLEPDEPERVDGLE